MMSYKRILSILGLILWAAILNSCRAVLHSDLTVPPNSQFVLGGNQTGAFSVRAKNNGNVSVALAERQHSGQTIVLAQFTPGSVQTFRLAGGSAVLIDNVAVTPARLDLTVTGDKDLSMKTTRK